MNEELIRFERAIYLHYINFGRKLKKVSKDEFFKNQNLDTFKDINFDKENIYRFADKKPFGMIALKILLGNLGILKELSHIGLFHNK